MMNQIMVILIEQAGLTEDLAELQALKDEIKDIQDKRWKLYNKICFPEEISCDPNQKYR